MRSLFLVSWLLAILVALLPLLYFLIFGWPAREAEFIDKVRNDTQMDEYFRKFWSQGRQNYLKKVPKASSATLFRARYRTLIGISRYVVPCLLFVAVVTVLTGLVVESAMRTGYDHYVAYYEDEAKSESALAKAGTPIQHPITVNRTDLTVLDRDFRPLPRIQLSLSALSAIAGAYLFMVAQLIQQCRARTLVYSDLFGAGLRLIVAVPLGLSLSTLASDSLGPFISFGLGAFPIGALSTLTRKLTAAQLKTDDPRADDDQTVAMLGVTQSVSDVLAQENITCAQQLCDIDPVVLAVRTGLSFDYVLFLAAQSLVWCFLGKTAASLAPIGLADARAIWYLMQKSPEDRQKVLTSVDKLLTAAATTQAPKPIDDVLLLQAFDKISIDPYTTFLVDFTSDLEKLKLQAASRSVMA